MTMYSLQALATWLKEGIESANADVRESRGIAPNSYGAGYDRGYLAGLKAALAEIPEEEKDD